MPRSVHPESQAEEEGPSQSCECNSGAQPAEEASRRWSLPSAQHPGGPGQAPAVEWGCREWWWGEVGSVWRGGCGVDNALRKCTKKGRQGHTAAREGWRCGWRGATLEQVADAGVWGSQAEAEEGKARRCWSQAACSVALDWSLNFSVLLISSAKGAGGG